MNRLFRCAIVVVTSLAAAAFAANTLSAGGHGGVVRCQSAEALGLGGIHIGGAAEYGQEWHYLHSMTPEEDRYGGPRQVSGAGYIGIGVAPMLDLAINLPAYYDNPQFGHTRPMGVGDLEVSVKLADIWLVSDKSPVTLAYYLAAQFPTGDETEGFFPRHAYYVGEGNWSSGEYIIHPMIISTIHFDRLQAAIPMKLHINVGGVFNTPEDNEALTVSLGFEASPADWVTLFTELSAEERFTTLDQKPWVSDLIDDPIFLTPGIKLTHPETGFYVTLAGDIGLSESNVDFAHTSYSETGKTVKHQANMLYNAYLAIGWQKPSGPKDADKDGIVDPEDKCPQEAGIAENSGCPDTDADNDGMVDRLDKCVNEAEDKDGFQDDDGCPDNDNDNDGILDANDKCPNEAGIAANNGCADVDSDNDGVPDRIDQCQNDPEDKDGYQDQDGCPDDDNDGDGIPDSMDKCPNNPGVAETQGCPKSKEITRDALVLKGVNFQSGKATLLSGSFVVLDEVAESLREWPEVNIEIQGHTDNTGNAAMNLQLSQERAESVRQYLIDKGIAPDRLTAVGYGPDRPIADNATREGRAKNRRVEITRSN
ncbi:MAG: OmpA family protein [Chitinispirillaceae bacterium]|nr:OmpA family protein [Chitinispirillaceae bacterium]